MRGPNILLTKFQAIHHAFPGAVCLIGLELTNGVDYKRRSCERTSEKICRGPVLEGRSYNWSRVWPQGAGRGTARTRVGPDCAPFEPGSAGVIHASGRKWRGRGSACKSHSSLFISVYGRFTCAGNFTDRYKQSDFVIIIIIDISHQLGKYVAWGASHRNWVKKRREPTGVRHE